MICLLLYFCDVIGNKHIIISITSEVDVGLHGNNVIHNITQTRSDRPIGPTAMWEHSRDERRNVRERARLRRASGRAPVRSACSARPDTRRGWTVRPPWRARQTTHWQYGPSARSTRRSRRWRHTRGRRGQTSPGRREERDL